MAGEEEVSLKIAETAPSFTTTTFTTDETKASKKKKTHKVGMYSVSDPKQKQDWDPSHVDT